MSQKPFLGVIIVAHDSVSVARTVEGVLTQSRPADQVVLVDCGSTDPTWVHRWPPGSRIRAIQTENIGYTGGNNRGWHELAADDGFVLFLNPDVLLPHDTFERLCRLMAEPRAARCGMVSPRLHGYDFGRDRPTERIDSTGVFPEWWGGWRDRRGKAPGECDVLEAVPALCGAFLFARVTALRAAALQGGDVFDSRYFAYKEDIELSLRLRRAGWSLGMWHALVAWHGRGWHANRRRMTRASRLLSARNELRLHATYAPWRLAYSSLKWLYVRFLER